MAKIYKNSAEVLAERAREPDPFVRLEPSGKRATTSSPVPPSRRMIYGGTMPPPPAMDEPTGIPQPPKNRKITRRRVSPFNIILILMGVAAASVLYISNIIAVDQLMNDINKEDVKLQQILNEQEMLRARINQMSSLEKVRKKAEEELGLQNPKGAPVWMDIDHEKVRDIEDALQKK
ncbi:MAG: hypothetical protein HY088_10165 [Ignavibacteriales bacterium]|nr:hypothetical protein [Ignavibacteriales bacterium]